MVSTGKHFLRELLDNVYLCSQTWSKGKMAIRIKINKFVHLFGQPVPIQEWLEVKAVWQVNVRQHTVINSQQILCSNDKTGADMPAEILTSSALWAHSELLLIGAKCKKIALSCLLLYKLQFAFTFTASFLSPLIGSSSSPVQDISGDSVYKQNIKDRKTVKVILIIEL